MDQKQEHIIRCIKLGMKRSQAYIVAQCTPEEIEIFDGNKAFQQSLKVYQAVEEKELLEKHEIAMAVAAEKGNTKPLEWRLGKMNPESWGPKTEVNLTGDIQIKPAPKPDEVKEGAVVV